MSEYNIVWKDGSFFESGKWVLVPKNDGGDGQIVGFILTMAIIIIVGSIVLLSLPFWVMVITITQMVKEKWIIGSIISLICYGYFLIDLDEEWVSSILFYGWNSSDGDFTEGILGEEAVKYFQIINSIAAIASIGVLINHFRLHKSNTEQHNSGIHKEENKQEIIDTNIKLPLDFGFHLFDNENNIDIGPIAIGRINDYKTYDTTYIWYDGLDDWVLIHDIESESDNTIQAILKIAFEDKIKDGLNDKLIENLRDELIYKAAKIVVENQQGSASMLQRKLQLSYNRAVKLISGLESLGILQDREHTSIRYVTISNVNEIIELIEK